MTTRSWTFGVDHSDDAGFRAWGADFSAALAYIGLTQTADTGQINWVTVTNPAINTDAGYEIWRFNDAAHSSAPIFIRFDFGTDNTVGRPRIRVTIGTGSNGSGTITGAIRTDYEISAGIGTPTGTSRTSYFSYSAGFLGLHWGRGGAATNVPYACFYLARSVDSNGDPDTHAVAYWATEGATSYITSQGENVQGVSSYNFDDAVAYDGTWGCGWMPHTISSNLNPGGDTAAYLMHGIDPHMFPIIGMCAVWLLDVPELSTFDAALVGSTEHTYINMGESGGTRPAIAVHESRSASVGHCMLWE